MKIRKITIDIVLMCLTFYEPSIVPHLIFIAFKYFVLLYLYISYVHEFRTDKKVMLVAFAFGLITTISTLINGMQINTCIASVFFSIQILSVFFLTSRAIKKITFKGYIAIIMKVFGSVILISDFFMLLFPYGFEGARDLYICGNKFVVSYLHCFVSALAYLLRENSSGGHEKPRYRRNRIKTLLKDRGPFLFSLYSIYICNKVDCTTGIIICLLLICLNLLPSSAKAFLASGKMVILTAIIGNVLIFGTYSILQNKYLLYFVVNILGKPSTYNGRFQIWAIIFDFIAKKPLIGYGYYNSIIESTLSYGNPQNGVLKLLMDSGIVGLGLYGLLVGLCVKRFGKKNYGIFPMIAFMYTMVVASFLEINLTHMIVFLSLALIWGYLLERKEL